jgi:hypothetical protein
MPGRVFISCGQAIDAERRVAGEVEQWFHSKGFTPHVAIATQSLADVNSGIIGELRRADFYVFIDFCRDELFRGRNTACADATVFRGSLFTNQELAIAYLLQFEKAIFFQQEGIERDGLLRYMASNATRFAKIEDVPALVAEKAQEREWHPSYTRHLGIGASHWSPVVPYVDDTGTRVVKGFLLDIHNRRADLGALNAICRLRSVKDLTSGVVFSGIDISPLKTTGQPGYARTIWPEDHGAWDLFTVSVQPPRAIFLNSCLDLWPRKPLIDKPGLYALEYQIFAENFPVLRFQIELQFTGSVEGTTAKVVTDAS